MMRRVILDTNVLVAGLRSRRGAAFQVLLRVGTGAFKHCLSVPLLYEYEDALKRREMKTPLAAEELEAVLDFIVSSASRRDIHYLWRPVLPDPHDDHVLEVAVAGRCDTVVTYNLRDFAGSERFGIRAQTPASFLASLARETRKAFKGGNR